LLGRYGGPTANGVESEIEKNRTMNAIDERFYQAQVVQRADFAADLWMIRVRCDGDFKFTPGQYATLGVEIDGKRIERPYSIASAPWEQEIEFFFELVPEGALTPHLYKLQPGDSLLMRKASKGRFTLDTENGRTHHLLVSTVTGVAPFVSFIRTLRKDWKEGKFDGSQQLYLLNGASRPWEFGYKDELNHFAEELPWFTYVPTVSRPWDHADWPGEIGRADDVLRKYADQWGLDAENTIAYLCGHPEMIERSKAILKRRGFTDKQSVKEEIYWVPAK
jgi:ferredoxin/flavodoxin---NADP+ reductase